MPVEFTRSWNDEEVERFRESWVRFVETEMQPQDAEARKRGHVGHELWRRAGELGFLCVDIPEEWGGAGGDFRHQAILHEEMARRALSGMSIGVHVVGARYKCHPARKVEMTPPLTVDRTSATLHHSQTPDRD